ncbi:hypothetical protein ES703_117256 [subsurface metagenome]
MHAGVVIEYADGQVGIGEGAVQGIGLTNQAPPFQAGIQARQPTFIRQVNPGPQAVGAAQKKEDIRPAAVAGNHGIIPGYSGSNCLEQCFVRGLKTPFGETQLPLVGHGHEGCHGIVGIKDHSGIQGGLRFVKAVGIHGINSAP